MPTFWSAPELATAGFPVFPTKDKKPTVDGGFYAFTRDHSKIAAWIQEGRGDHDPAIPTGVLSGVVVIEADNPETDAQMRASYGEPTALSARQLGHWYFRHPKNHRVTSNNVRPGLDRKGDGGYIVVPPGKGRTWTNGIPKIEDLPVLPKEFWTKEDPSSDAPRNMPTEKKEAAASAVASRVAQLEEGERHEHLKHLCGALLSRDVAKGDAEDILVGAWTRVGGNLAKRAAREVPNTLRTTERAIADGRATGVPKLEGITPGLSAELGSLFGWNATLKTTQRKSKDDMNDKPDKNYKELSELPDPDRFPLEALPPSVRQFVREGAASIGCPVDFVGVSVLAVLSAAIGDTRRLVIKRDWLEGPCLYTMIIGPPASKKSPAMRLALRPVRERQIRLKNEYEVMKEAYDEEETETKPVLGRSYVDDVTVERLADILNQNPRGVLVTKDELSGWLGSMNQYKQGGKGGDRPFWLSVHTNEPLAVDRKSSDEPVIVARPFASILGGIQPRVLPDFGADRGDGLIDRFLPSYPLPAVSGWTDDEVSDEAWNAYMDTVSRLYRLKHAEWDGDVFPSKVSMTGEAKTLFAHAYNALQQEAASPGFPERLQESWGKLAGHLGRLALILAMTRVAELEGRGQFVEERLEKADMLGAIRLLEYFQNHLRRMFTGLYSESETDRLAADLKTFLEARGGFWEGTAAELHAALDSDYKPEYPKEFAKLVRAISKRSALLRMEDLKRTADRRPFRISLESLSSLSSLSSERA